jgi:uncharacterized membrane protein YraQ (UPF0718 family)
MGAGTSRGLVTVMPMSAAVSPTGLRRPRRRTTAAVPVGTFFLLFVAGETWAKWWPYAHKLVSVGKTHSYPGRPFLDAAGRAGSTPSLAHAWNFTLTYGKSVWPALVAALVVAAAVEALLPTDAIVRFMGKTGLRGSVHGAVGALPCFMCTCCSAPVTVALRRAGASSASALGYWLANPMLNPAVLAFLAFVLPWQFALTRLVVGAALVLAVPTLVSRFWPAAPGTGPSAHQRATAAPGVQAPPQRTFARALARLVAILVPEYFVAVVAVGALRGWLMPLGHDAASWGLVAVLIAAVAGAVLVIPTGAVIPVIAALSASGFGAGVAGAVLIALPAISVPSMVMVGRDLSVKAVGATATGVILAALVSAGLLSLLY